MYAFIQVIGVYRPHTRKNVSAGNHRVVSTGSLRCVHIVEGCTAIRLESRSDHRGEMGSAAILFSDIDGTLVHYPKEFSEYADIVNEDGIRALVRYRTGEERECVVLGSLTGGKAYMSTRTSALIGELRGLGTKVALVTGARTSTYLRRRALLPVVDYEIFENGGRLLHDGKTDATWGARFIDAIGNGATSDALQPELAPPAQRSGELWRCYEELASDGWNLDARDYVTNFRVRTGGERSDEMFERTVVPTLAARGLASSFNLGKADVYPAMSGKANAARRVLDQLSVSAADAVAMFDDDNDLELGALCGGAYLPGVTHPRVLEALGENESRWILTKQRGFLGSEEALDAIIAVRKASISVEV